MQIKPEIQVLIDQKKPIDKETWKSLRMNSYERQELIPLLDNKALAHVLSQTLDNLSPPRTIPVTYRDSLKHLSRIAIKRLEAS